MRKIAFPGDYVPRKCGIATFTSDLLAAVTADQPRAQREASSTLLDDPISALPRRFTLGAIPAIP